MNALTELQVERRPIIDRTSWLEWRTHDVTASDVAALFGQHPFGKTRLSLWADKRGLLGEGMADNGVLQRGRWGEAAVIEMLADERPEWFIHRSKVYLRDRAIRLGATPDAEAVDPQRAGIGIIQAKTVADSAFEQWENDEPPLGYQLQALTEMMLAGATWGAIATLVMDRYAWRPVIFEMERHEAAEARIRSAVAQFWNDFDADLMPVLDPEQDAETVQAMYPKAEIKAPKALDLRSDNELPGLLATRATLSRLAKEAGKEIETIETKVKAKVGLYERAQAQGWRIGWKNEPRAGHVVKASNPRILRISEGYYNG
jgi:predicted phage-related endonuclease